MKVYKYIGDNKDLLLPLSSLHQHKVFDGFVKNSCQIDFDIHVSWLLICTLSLYRMGNSDLKAGLLFFCQRELVWPMTVAPLPAYLAYELSSRTAVSITLITYTPSIQHNIYNIVNTQYRFIERLNDDSKVLGFLISPVSGFPS